MLQYLVVKGSHEKISYYDNVETDADELFLSVERKMCRKYKVEYYNIPVTFDIETTSFYEDDEKRACMYVWMFSIDDNIIIGRTWNEFLLLCEKLKQTFSLHPKYRHMIIYVQNLGFEFQFISHLFTWDKVFALNNRVPLYALTSTGIEFKCSYQLSGYNLAKMGENLQKYKVRKMVGDLDYSLKRHSKTPLDDKELLYCLNDVRVLSSYIREKIETDGAITKIPLTKTGYVRQYCRKHIYADHKSKDYRYYRQMMLNLTMTSDEFKLLQEAFQGGFTHANPFYVGKTLHNMTSKDFNSSYPTVMIAEKFPMGRGEVYAPKDDNDLKYQLSHYCCVFSCRLTGIKSKILFDNYLSYSKCRYVDKPILSNGRIVSANYLETTITNLDYEIIKACYECDKFEILTFYRYKKAYLPTEFVNCVLDFYEKKTTLKGIEGKEVEYLQGKENLNSCYGMCVTNPAKPIITFNDDWIENPLDLETELEKHNKSVNRFLFYPWGVFVTAYARYNLWVHGILKVRDDYVYADTDSIKYLNPSAHDDFVKDYNILIGTKLLKALRYHKIDPERVAPKTIKGVPKPLGIWDSDGDYDSFKTLGAKRYVSYSSTEGLKITIAGLPKKAGKKYLEKFNDPFKAFKNDMVVPAGEASKQTATYIDYETQGEFYDYMGVKGTYHEMSSLHLENTGYDLSMASDFVNYVLGIGDMDL